MDEEKEIIIDGLYAEDEEGTIRKLAGGKHTAFKDTETTATLKDGRRIEYFGKNDIWAIPNKVAKGEKVKTKMNKYRVLLTRVQILDYREVFATSEAEAVSKTKNTFSKQDYDDYDNIKVELLEEDELEGEN